MNFSKRYNYFYANFLINSGRVKDAEKIINSSLKLYPRNVLLKQFKIDLQNKKLLKKKTLIANIHLMWLQKFSIYLLMLYRLNHFIQSQVFI